MLPIRKELFFISLLACLSAGPGPDGYQAVPAQGFTAHLADELKRQLRHISYDVLPVDKVRTQMSCAPLSQPGLESAFFIV